MTTEIENLLARVAKPVEFDTFKDKEANVLLERKDYVLLKTIAQAALKDMAEGKRMVPAEWPEDNWRELGYALDFPAPANQYKALIKAAPPSHVEQVVKEIGDMTE